MEAVQLIADHVRAHDCQLHPDSIEVRGNECLCSKYLLCMAYQNGIPSLSLSFYFFSNGEDCL